MQVFHREQNLASDCGRREILKSSSFVLDKGEKITSGKKFRNDIPSIVRDVIYSPINPQTDIVFSDRKTFSRVMMFGCAAT